MSRRPDQDQDQYGMKYAQLDIADLERETAALARRYSAVSDSNLSLDLTRGKPAPDQLDLSNALDGILDGDYMSASGIDARNYGDLRGLPEARELGAEILGLDAEQIIADGPSSLTLMYQVMDAAFHYGLSGPAWADEPPVKAICSVPGYDRHFTITESFGVEMINVPMTAAGPDMDRVEALVDADPSIKCIWCVPKYSNPSGCVYSPETVRRIAALANRASAGFIVLWDNAYAVHDFEFPPVILDDVLARAEACGTADNVVVFGSTSKITFAGGGVSFVAGSPKTLDRLEARLSVMLIGHDKVNQLRHARLLCGRVEAHMRAHADLVRPRFEAVDRILHASLDGLGIAEWSRPRGGYFIVLDTIPGLAAEVVDLAGRAGVRLTPAGATHPYGRDPDDKTIRLAPTFAALEEVEAATEVLALCIRLASARRIRADGDA